MTPLDRIVRRQCLKEQLAPAAATHQYVLDDPSPIKPADRNALLDPRRAGWTSKLDCLTPHANPNYGGDSARQGPVQERARHAAGRFAGPAETALRAAVERAERALSDEGDCYSVSETHDAAFDLAQAARNLLNELETRHTK